MNDMGKRRTRRTASRPRRDAAGDPFVRMPDPLVIALRPAVTKALKEAEERKDPLKRIAAEVREQLDLDQIAETMRTLLELQDDDV